MFTILSQTRTKRAQQTVSDERGPGEDKQNVEDGPESADVEASITKGLDNGDRGNIESKQHHGEREQGKCFATPMIELNIVGSQQIEIHWLDVASGLDHDHREKAKLVDWLEETVRDEENVHDRP